MDDILKVLKRRRRSLRKRIKEEENQQSRLQNKSRRVKTMSPHCGRANWYTDRLHELELVIDMIEGRVSEKDFVKWLAGDGTDQLLTMVGNVTG